MADQERLLILSRFFCNVSLHLSGGYAINMSKSNQSVYSFLTFSVTDNLIKWTGLFTTVFTKFCLNSHTNSFPYGQFVKEKVTPN